MIKIFHFITDTNVGGAGKLLINQLKNMDMTGLDVTVVLPHGSRLAEMLKGLPCKVLEAEHCADRSFSLESVAEDMRIIKKHRPDIVHSHASLSSRIAATLLGTQARIHTRHCVFPLPAAFKNPIGRTVCGLGNNILSTKMIACAESVKNELVDMGCDENKISVILNGSDPIVRSSPRERSAIRKELSFSDSDFVVGICARLEEYKGHKTFLKAAAICKRQYPAFKFLVIGDGSQRQELMGFCESLGLSRDVRFTGFASDVSPFLNALDVNVNCSYISETSSLALSEGMSLGIPSVVSDLSGNTEMVNNCFNGFVFKRKDHEALAICLIRLYRDPKLYKRLSENALERYLSEFTAKAMAKKMRDVYLCEAKTASERIARKVIRE